jgi:heme A synthase
VAYRETRLAYLGLGVPTVIGGVLVTEVNGVLATAREYGAAVILLAALALAGLLLHRPAKTPAAAAVAVGCESPR